MELISPGENSLNTFQTSLHSSRITVKCDYHYIIP